MEISRTTRELKKIMKKDSNLEGIHLLKWM